MNIFKSNKSDISIQELDTGTDNVKVIFRDKPKILLIDLDSISQQSLQQNGYNVVSGTFGQPYKVDMSSAYEQLQAKTVLPNHNEQEVIVIDLKYEIAQYSEGETERPRGETDLWCKCDRGFIDPRTRGVVQVHQAFQKIYENGGVFIVFANDKSDVDIKLGKIDRYNRFEFDGEFPVDEWSFLGKLDGLEVSSCYGKEMFIDNINSAIGKLLNYHLSGSEYTCIIEPVSKSNTSWSVLAKNKFGQTVALQHTDDLKGSVFILPQLKNKSGFLKSLFTEVLPEIAPHLFPDIDKGKWTHFADYELPAIKQLLKDKNTLEQNFISESKLIDEKILEERSIDGWLHDLITQTGDPLVHAIIKGLQSLGFKNIIDVDIERDKLGLARREDLQIQDKSPILVVDIKGIANFPSDDDVLQANKHATLLMKEQKRTDINSLSIINHQRHLEPLQRDNILPFRQELLSLASELSMSLITSWDFYRLVINAKLNKWKFLEIQDILYNSGRSEIIPSHYKYLGKITIVWSEKFGVLIENNSLKIDQKIAIEFPILFEEAEVKELVVNDAKVNSVTIGDKTGISWPINNTKLKKGMRVFSVN